LNPLTFGRSKTGNSSRPNPFMQIIRSSINEKYLLIIHLILYPTYKLCRGAS
jgi:hypothetical protein